MVIAAVDVLVVPLYDIKLPPAVNLTLWISVFLARIEQTILEWVPFYVLELCFSE